MKTRHFTGKYKYSSHPQVPSLTTTHRPLLPGKVKVKFALEQTMKAQMGSRGITLLFL
jgi:hypothetical protein